MSATSTDQISAGPRPELLLGAAAACAAVGALLLLPSAGWGLHVVGYLLAAPVAFTLVVFFRRSAERHRTLRGEVVAAWTFQAGRAVIVLGLIVAILHAWGVARHFA